MASCKNDFLCTLDEVQFECTLYRFSLRKPSSYRYQHSKEVMASQKIKFVLIWAIRRDFRKEQDRKCPWPKIIGYCKLVVKCYNRFAFTSAIYKCSYCFINSKANLTLVKVVLNWSHIFFSLVECQFARTRTLVWSSAHAVHGCLTCSPWRRTEKASSFCFTGQGVY